MTESKETSAIDILTKISRNSYNNFIEVHLPKILERTVLNVNKNQVNGEFKTQMKVSFFDSKDKEEIKIGEISVNPNEARLKGFTYSMPIYTNMKIELIHNDERMIIPFENFKLLDFPVMLHSKYCNLYSKSSVELESGRTRRLLYHRWERKDNCFPRRFEKKFNND